MFQYSPSAKQPTTLMQAVVYFSDPDRAAAYVESIKWPDGPVCHACGSRNVGYIASRRRYQCREKGCRKQCSLTTNTIMEATHLRLDQWLIAAWMLVNCRNGVSSCEIARTIGCKQQSAWHLLHRLRALFVPEHDGQFSGICESDETFVGGLFKFMSYKRWQRARKHGNKTVVHAIKERSSGKVRAEVIPAAQTDYVRDAVLEHVEKGSRLYTDASHVYGWNKRSSYYKHRAVNHAEQYVKGDVHTNGCENFFNCLRRAVKGTYIKPTAEHLGPYVDEAVFRFNVRHEGEWQRFDAAMQRIVGKRLTYSSLTNGAKR